VKTEVQFQFNQEQWKKEAWHL